MNANNVTRNIENDQQFLIALARYNELYDNRMYSDAVGDNIELGIALQNAALGYCGSPYHQVPNSIHEVVSQYTQNSPSYRYLMACEFLAVFASNRNRRIIHQ